MRFLFKALVLGLITVVYISCVTIEVCVKVPSTEESK